MSSKSWEEHTSYCNKNFSLSLSHSLSLSLSLSGDLLSFLVEKIGSVKNTLKLWVRLASCMRVSVWPDGYTVGRFTTMKIGQKDFFTKVCFKIFQLVNKPLEIAKIFAKVAKIWQIWSQWWVCTIVFQSLPPNWLFFPTNPLVFCHSYAKATASRGWLWPVWPDCLFLKCFFTNFITKIAQILADFWAYLKNVTIYVTTPVYSYWVTFVNNWATFLHHLVTLAVKQFVDREHFAVGWT